MGIVKKELAKFELTSGEKCIIELNEGDIIHIHIGVIRIDMTPSEFEHFVEVVAEGKKELQNIKDINSCTNRKL